MEYESYLHKLISLKPVCIAIKEDSDLKEFFDIALKQGIDYYGAKGYIDEACKKGSFLIYDYTLGVVPSRVPYGEELCDGNGFLEEDYEIITISELKEEIEGHPELLV